MKLKEILNSKNQMLTKLIFNLCIFFILLVFIIRFVFHPIKPTQFNVAIFILFIPNFANLSTNFNFKK